MRIQLIFPTVMMALGLAGASTAHAGVSLDRLDDGWAQSALTSAAALQSSNPDLADAILAAEPRPSRSGVPLFIDPTWYTPEAAGTILVRFAGGEDTPAERAALLDALSRTGGQWVPAVAGLLAHETEPAVRRMIVELMRDAPVATARDVVQAALKDSDPGVRTAALRVIGFHPSGSDLASLGLASLSDPVATVRSEAARSIGYSGYAQGFEPIRTLLADSDANVRFRALRSLEKLDIARVKTLSELGTLAVDNDAKVAQEAQKLLVR
ncbi:MAG: hypothetical protein CL927_12635 [Deltaproteobacteria bacterium]|nr:hypothetical protein [Deltaproteobacteria bacterium]HCH63988.1 hypothetical protein [Deltaproteobacteria bacterium]